MTINKKNFVLTIFPVYVTAELGEIGEEGTLPQCGFTNSLREVSVSGWVGPFIILPSRTLFLNLIGSELTLG